MSSRHAFFHRQPKIPVSRKTGIHAAAPARCFFQQFSFTQPRYNRLHSICLIVFQPFIRLNIPYLWLNLLYHSVVLFSISIHACNTIISKWHEETECITVSILMTTVLSLPILSFLLQSAQNRRHLEACFRISS